MRNKLALILLSVVAAVIGVVAVVSAGDPDTPPGPPEMTSSYTLEDIYDRLDTGVTGTPITFTEPITGPGVGTMHTLDEIYDLVGKRAFVPQTGQTKCFNSGGVEIACAGTGQDGDLQKGADWITSTRFITGTTGTTGVTVVVTDTLTGLIWLQDANCIANQYPSFDTDGQVSWQQALDFTAGITVTGLYSNCAAGFSDWRLPNVRELHSLIDYEERNTALPEGHPFTSDYSGGYWSSDSYIPSPSLAWYVDMSYGMVNYALKGSQNYEVWPVRGGQ